MRRTTIFLADVTSAMLIDIEGASVVRGGRMVLHDVVLKLRGGEHLAILGPNGCGKSTLLKLLTCELYPVVRPGTRVSLFGRSRWDLTDLRRRLGVVAADPPGHAMRHTSGYEAILTGFFSSATLWPHLQVSSAMRSHAEHLLEQVGAERLRDKPVGEMSAGEQRRIMIARALAGSALERLDGAERGGNAAVLSEMLLLDEPSNGLDLAAQHELRELLRTLARHGTSIVLVTHHVSDIIPEIERVLLMRAGRILADGRRSELLTAEALSELFEVPIALTERDGFLHAW